MTVDVISFFVFFVLVFFGWRSGALRQILRVVAILAVIIGVPFISPLFREFVFGEPGRASPGIEVLSLLGAGILIYLSLSLSGWLVIRTIRAVSATVSFVDRVGGASIGAAKATIVVYLLLVLVVFMEGPLRDRDPENKMGLREGSLTSFVSDFNVLAPWQFPDIGRLHQALRVGMDVEFENGIDGPGAAEFLLDERVQELLADDDLMDWVRQDHYPMTLADRRVRDLLNDDEMVEKLNRVDWVHLESQFHDLPDV